jgi:sugar/nucleoside kinase (ribokinase family)
MLTGIFVGLSTLDVIQLVDRLPLPNEKISSIDLVVAAGGPAANAAVVFAALGGRSILVTRISNDSIGELVMNDLLSHGVEVRNADPSGSGTAVASIMVTATTGERAVVSVADQGRSGGESESDYGQGLVEEVHPEVVLVDSYELDVSMPIVRDAATCGVPVLLDCGGKKPHTHTQLPYVDGAIVSEEYLLGGPDAIAEDIGHFGVRFGAITAGSHPVKFWAGDYMKLAEQPVVPVEVVDTLGAGDFFHGALAFAVAAYGLDERTFEKSLAFASRVAGVSIQEFGSRSWLSKLAQFLVE